MKFKKYLIPLFLLVTAIQLAVPFKMIWDKEKTLRKGQTYKFRTAPIDPNDPFRGKYIYLNYNQKITQYQTNDSTFKNIKKVYVTYETGPDGYAKIKNVSRQKPQNTHYYLETAARYIDYNPKQAYILLNYPFNKFYMEEFKAPQAEKAYRNTHRNSESESYAIVNIYNGQAALKNVIIDGKSVKEVVK